MHPLQTSPGVSGGRISLAPQHDYPPTSRAVLRVSDQRGLSGTKTVRIDPRTVDSRSPRIRPGSIVAGLLDGTGLAFRRPGDRRLRNPALGAADGEMDGKAYNSQSWSDSGARSHSILAILRHTPSLRDLDDRRPHR